MSLSPNKIILANAATNTAGAYFEAYAVNATSSGVTVPAGLYQALPTANVVIQFNTSTNIASPTWTNILLQTLLVSCGLMVLTSRLCQPTHLQPLRFTAQMVDRTCLAHTTHHKEC